MTDKDLINQLKTLKNIYPNKDWVVSTRSNLVGHSPKASFNLLNALALPVPRMAAIPVMAAVVALVGGITIVRDANYNGGSFVASIRYKSLSVETREELKEIVASVNPSGSDPVGYGVRPRAIDDSGLTVVFDEGADAQESFKDALRNRIEAKIGRIKDLFAQLEDGDLAREISLNPRRFEENFKLADAELGKQVKSLLADAEAALAEGNLIDALDMVNAIEKLLD